MVEMEKAMSQLWSIHQMGLEMKDTFCEAEKEIVAKELQGMYNAMLLERDALQFKEKYQWKYSEVIEDAEEHLRCLGEVAMPEAPTEEVSELSCIGEA